MTKNEKLYETAMEAIKTLFNDQSVDQATAKENLQGLRDEIDVMIDTLD